MKFTIVTDGTSDKILKYPLIWLLTKRVVFQQEVTVEWAEIRNTDLTAKIRQALDLYPSDVLFIHRDSEQQHSEPRYQEIKNAVEKLKLNPPVPFVCIVPIRMTEAWFLFDETAIRRAAGNSNGTNRLQLPRLREVESTSDPKAMLHQQLILASGLTGRRRDEFKPHQALHRLAELIDDYSPLLQLSAFRTLERDIRQLATELNIL